MTLILTLREQEVLRLAAKGLHNGEIASRLAITQNTVKTHLSAINKRLGTTSRMEAALRVGFLSVSE